MRAHASVLFVMHAGCVSTATRTVLPPHWCRAALCCPLPCRAVGLQWANMSMAVRGTHHRMLRLQFLTACKPGGSAP